MVNTMHPTYYVITQKLMTCQHMTIFGWEESYPMEENAISSIGNLKNILSLGFETIVVHSRQYL